MLIFRYSLTNQKINEYRAQFYKFTCGRNKDQDHLEAEEVLHFIRKQGFEIRLSDLEEMSKDIFTQSRKITFSCWEVISLIGRLSIGSDVEKEIKSIFTFFDIFRKNKLTAIELKNGFQKLNESISNQETNQIFSEFDIDKDGFISFEQFLSAILQR